MAVKLLLSLICIISLTSSQSCNNNTQCDYPNEICNEQTCYGRFNATYYANYSLRSGSGLEPPGDNPTGIDISPLFDGDIDTGIALDAGAWTYLRVDFPGNSNGSWIHQIVFVTNVTAAQFAFYLDGVNTGQSATTNTDTGNSVLTWDGFNYPFFAKDIIIRFFPTATIKLISLDIYGARDSPEPTSAPSMSPTGLNIDYIHAILRDIQSSLIYAAKTRNPSVSPTRSPTDEPTKAPTGFPTPDVCDEFIVTQNCCGNYGYIPTSDKINLRDPSLTTCLYSFESQCCGNTGLAASGWRYLSESTYGCDGTSIQGGTNICLPSLWNSSLNTTDDIYGPTVDVYSIFTPDPNVEALEGTQNPDMCQCNWTVYECEGEDEAVCGTELDYEGLYALDCWDNETYAPADLVNLNLTDTQCWTDNQQDFEYLLYEPCSEQSFLGSVTNIERMPIPDESILDNDCSCSYFITNCRILEDRGTIGECLEEVANPCCTTDFDYEYTYFTRNGVNATLNATIGEDGKPDPGGWTCSNGLDLCPDLWNNSRKYQDENRVDWWYDNGELNSVCGCKYVVDECNLPSVDPTMDPTADPTEVPTFEPTDSDGDGANEIKISLTVIMGILSIISLL